jgi:hypothetical protein
MVEKCHTASETFWPLLESFFFRYYWPLWRVCMTILMWCRGSYKKTCMSLHLCGFCIFSGPLYTLTVHTCPLLSSLDEKQHYAFLRSRAPHCFGSRNYMFSYCKVEVLILCVEVVSILCRVELVLCMELEMCMVESAYYKVTEAACSMLV